MEIKYKSLIASFYRLMPRAYFLNRNDMEQKRIQVKYGDVTYDVNVLLEYVGLDCHISAEVGNTQLLFEPNAAGGIDVIIHGDELPQKLINQIKITVLQALED